MKREVGKTFDELKHKLTLPEITSDLKQEVVEHAKKELGELYTCKEVVDALKKDENIIIFAGDHNLVREVDFPRDKRALFLGKYNVMTNCTAGIYDSLSETKIEEGEE